MNPLPKVLEDILERRYVLKQNFVIEQTEEEDLFTEKEIVDIGTTIASFIPGVGDLVSLYDFVDSVIEGEYGEAALALASAVPVIGAPVDVIRAARKVKRTIEKLPNLPKVNQKLKFAKEVEVPSKQSPDYPKQMFKSDGDGVAVEVKPTQPKPDYTPWTTPPKPKPSTKPETKPEIVPEPKPISIPKIKPFKWGRELFPETQPFTPPELPTPEAETETEPKAELDPLAQRITVMAAPSIVGTPTPLPQPQPQPEKLEKEISTKTKEDEDEERRKRGFPSFQVQDRKPRSLQSLMGTGVPADTGLQKKLFLGQFGGTYQIR